jgi:hypothetical protein
MKDFFEDPPEHDLAVGDLVTCTCHGGVAVIIELYDIGKDTDVQMNMAKIWWIVLPHNGLSRVWMHTIRRLNRYPARWKEIIGSGSMQQY